MEELRKPVLQGVHIDVSFLITRLGLPENFQDVEFIEARFVYKQLPNIMVVYDSSKITVSDNKVSVIIPDTDSNRLIIGDYDLHFLYKKTNVLRPNLYEPFRLVLPAFKLVKTTAELGGVVPTDLEVQSVEIQGEMFIARDGLNGNSAFEIWQAFIGTPESTETDYLAWQRKPADEAAGAANGAAGAANAATSELAAIKQFLSQAESGRNTAEGNRETKEGERNQSEQTRNTKEAAREQAEQQRSQSESTRDQSEQNRSTAEGGRSQAETLRSQSELDRKQNETNRENAEQTRETKEGARNQAELDRETKEGERNQSESSRNNAESDRDQAEQARTLAEQDRKQSETERGTTFTNKIQESEQATTAANVAANAQNAYNVTVAGPLAAGVYYTKATARAAVPVASRKIGLVNTYALSASTWYTEKYIGANVSGWTTESNWEQVPDAARVAAIETDLNTKVTKLDIEINGDKKEAEYAMPKSYSFTTLISNYLFKKDVAYTLKVYAQVNPQSIYTKVVDNAGTELFRVSLLGYDVLFGQAIYTPLQDTMGSVLCSSPYGVTTVKASLESESTNISERISAIEDELYSSEYTEIDLKYLEFGSLTGGFLTTIQKDFKFFFNKLRLGRLIKTKYIKIQQAGLTGQVFTFGGDFSLINTFNFMDNFEYHLTSNESYINLSLGSYDDLSFKKEVGFIDNLGVDTSSKNGCRLNGYFSYNELRNIVFTSIFSPMRAQIYCYDESYAFIKKFVYELSNYRLELSNTSETDYPSNGTYYRVVLLRSYNALTTDEYNSVKVMSLQKLRFLPKIKAKVSSNYKDICLPNFSVDTINSLYKVIPHNGLRYSETFVNKEYIDTQNYFNSYILLLPPNYDPNGKPVRCIIWGGGTGSMNGWQKKDFNPDHTKQEMSYLASEGFAVVWFLGVTSKYLPTYLGSLSDFALPTSIKAHCQGYKYISSRYNIADDGCFVASKSLGGILAAQLLFEKNIPILAACPLAPKLNGYPTSFTMDNIYNGAKMYAEEFQWDDGWQKFFDGSSYTIEERDIYMKSQIRKVLGTQPMINGIVGKSVDELFQLARYGVDDSSIGRCSRYVNTPIRIYISSEDEAVSYNLAKNFIQSLQNGGSPAELRTLPAPAEGDSGHAMVDTAPSCPKIASVTTFNGEVFTNVALPFVEMVQFFREHDK